MFISIVMLNGVYFQVVETAIALQEAGCFAVVLECVPPPVAAAATAALRIPTMGIGAGPFCSGQVSRLHRHPYICHTHTHTHIHIHV